MPAVIFVRQFKRYSQRLAERTRDACGHCLRNPAEQMRFALEYLTHCSGALNTNIVGKGQPSG